MEEELRKNAATGLLKGCQQHFRSQVTRVSKITGAAVSPELRDHFKDRAMSLLDAGTLDEFRRIAQALLDDFPLIEKWLRWWMREQHAKMLFQPFRTTDPVVWTALPSTTNAQEAMHWKLYRAAGKNHRLLDGLVFLFAFALGYEKLAAARLAGVKTHYGQAQRWKKTKLNLGTTKPSRARAARMKQKNDGRPPDTSHELVKRPPSDVVHYRPGYRWKKNSRWLDCSLELMFLAVLPDFHTDFEPRFHGMHHASPLWHLYKLFDLRIYLSENAEASSDLLAIQRSSGRGSCRSSRSGGAAFSRCPPTRGYPWVPKF
ncbi:hypothetical protein BDR05DRAFT_912948 [Suillus weaverae]|nr:hypothetical protein BDR05DRAFT_912948 [Suillus weaverae]